MTGKEIELLNPLDLEVSIIVDMEEHK